MKSTSVYTPIILLLLISFFAPPAVSQNLADQISVTLDVYLPEGGTIFLGDLGLTDLGTAPLIFAVTIENSYPTLKMVTMQFGIRRGDQILLEGTSKPFEVAPGKLYLTNQNILQSGSQYSLQNLDISDATDELLNTVLASGKLPNGAYQFYVKILENDQPQDEEIREIFINSPTILTLVSPGVPADMPVLTEVFSPLPFFQWESNASRFEITICEKLPSNSSPEDAMNNEPRVQEIIEYGNYFQYPPDAWELEPGKTYFWQVVAIVPSSGGDVRMESEIWGFKISNVGNGVSNLEHEQLMTYLGLLLDNQELSALFGEGGPLEGFAFSGLATQNGQQISTDVLNELVNLFLQGKLNVKSVNVQ